MLLLLRFFYFLLFPFWYSFLANFKKEYESLSSKYAKHMGVDYSKPSCTYCHRRERHNRATQLPLQRIPVQIEFCGDLIRHKDEKDIVTSAWYKLKAPNKVLEKPQNT